MLISCLLDKSTVLFHRSTGAMVGACSPESNFSWSRHWHSDKKSYNTEKLFLLRGWDLWQFLWYLAGVASLQPFNIESYMDREAFRVISMHAMERKMFRTFRRFGLQNRQYNQRRPASQLLSSLTNERRRRWLVDQNVNTLVIISDFSAGKPVFTCTNMSFSWSVLSEDLGLQQHDVVQMRPRTLKALSSQSYLSWRRN